MSDISHRYAVIVAGGSGTRLWPVSRHDLPKQMQSFISDKTLIDETAERLESIVDKKNIYISTTSNYADNIKRLLPDLPQENIIVEPVANGTTAAFSLFCQVINERDPQAVVFTLASDHAVTDMPKFKTVIEESYDFISNNPDNIALIGIKPTKPNTGLGYIKVGDIISRDPLVYSVEKFVEKPSMSVAKRYVESGKYFWNAAYYCFMPATLLKAYDEANPVINQAVGNYIRSGSTDDYLKAPDEVHEIELIDTGKFPLALLPGEFRWSDIGDWQSLHAVLSDIEGNKDRLIDNITGHYVDLDSHNCLVFSDSGRLITTLGLKDLVIVDTGDTLLVINKQRSQDIKKLINKVKQEGLDRYL